MALQLDFLLPPPPKDWDSNHDVKVHKRISPVKSGSVEPVGAEFLAVLRRNRYNRSLTQDWELEAALQGANDGGDDDDLEDEPETKELLASNPDKWKDQDHYAILGISKLRWRATDDQIKRAYRKKVLKHHPDKKAAASGRTNDDAYFKCLQKAWEIMTDPKLRRQWDSCDPQFDETLPITLKKGQDFYKVFGEAFTKEARFGNDTRILTAQFGDDNSTREEVENFYDLWLSFDSWRTFERMDEEEEGLDDSREAKRWLDKKNRAARTKLKKEDNQRVAKFIEAAMKLDPRIQRIKAAEREAREAKKNAGANAKKAAEEEAKRLAEEARIEDEARLAEEKIAREAEKKEREAHKKIARKARKAIKDLFAEHGSFLKTGAKITELEDQQTKFDALLEGLELWQLEEFKERLDANVAKGVDALNMCFQEEVTLLKTRQASEAATSAAKSAANAAASASVKKTKAPWSNKEVTTLIKAVKTFPGGTISRWEKIAEYINLHGVEDPSQSNERTADECIKKSKEMQDATVADRNALQAAAAEAAQKKKAAEIKERPSDRSEVNSDLAVPTPSSAKSVKAATPAASVTGVTAGGFVLPENDTWSAAQQTQLEDGLKKFPASQFSASPAKRWEAVANEVEGRSVKEVKQRMKDLQDAVSKKSTKKK
ncbi:hypothetical protein BC830DRAFT_1169812 [Chytriomyces sp. MP71]|nr:hypothetical protein BC830DRAFT_1169812 [Chytriomyces sp. MP71]